VNDKAALQENLKAAIRNRTHWIDLRVLDASGKVVATEPAGAGNLPPGLSEKLVGEVRGGVPDVETDWTRGEGLYLVAVAVPLEGGGAVVARIDGVALKEPLHGITLPDRAVVTLLDQRYRVVYRSQTPESAIGMDLSNSEFLPALQNQNTGLVVVKSSIDGVDVSTARARRQNWLRCHGRYSSAILYASAWRQLMGYALVGLLVVFCTMTGALLIARSIAGQCGSLTWPLKVRGGNFSARAPTEGKDEMSRLGMNFNAMAERLQKREARC
jgi:hypothetical protein